MSEPLQSVVHSCASAPPGRALEALSPGVRRADPSGDRSWRALAACLRRGSPTAHLPAMNLCEVLAQLPERDRAILLMRAFDDLTIPQTAAALGIDPADADQRYAHALGRLREAWQSSPACRAFWKPYRLGHDSRRLTP